MLFIATVITLYSHLLLLLLIHLLPHGVSWRHDVLTVSWTTTLLLRLVLMCSTNISTIIIFLIWSLVRWNRDIVMYINIDETRTRLFICCCVIYVFLRMLESSGVDHLRLLSNNIFIFSNILVDVWVVLFLQSRPSFLLIFINRVIKEGLRLRRLWVLLHINITVILHLTVEHASFLR